MSAEEKAQPDVPDAKRVHRSRPKPRFTRKSLPVELRQASGWPGIDPTHMEAADLELFERMKKGIELYIAAGDIRDALAKLDLTYEQVQRAVDRCVTTHEDGRLFGFRALLPNMRVRRYERRKAVRAREPGSKGGYSGALCQLFKKYPEIEPALAEYLLTRRREDGAEEARIRHKDLHEYFLEVCANAGVGAHEYPNTVEQRGKSAIRKYAIAFFDANYDAIAEAQFGATALAKSRTGKGYRSRLTATQPFDVVEVDEHRAHFIGAMLIRTASGWRWIPIRRIVLITVTDRRSGVVLGYHAVFKREVDADDLLAAIQNALDRWGPRDFYLPGQSYDEGAGFASGRHERLVNCGWSTLLFDNALVHLAKDVIDRVRSIVGCDISYGPVRRFERRAIGELVFKRLSEHGFERVRSTTGSKAGDGRRRNAERFAKAARMSMGAALDLIELAIAHYNHTETKRCEGVSALDFLEDWVSDPDSGTLAPQLPERPSHIPPLGIAIVPVNITGNRKTGTRPRVYFEGEYYTCPELSKRWKLIGTPAIAHANPNDIRTIQLYSLKGEWLATLIAPDDWGDESHSRDIRRYVQQLTAAGKRPKEGGKGWLRRFLKGLEAQALREEKRGGVSDAATRLAEEERKRSRPAAPLPPAANDARHATAPTAVASGASADSSSRRAATPPAVPKPVRPLVLPTQFKAFN
jgi:hypothetical protein